MSCFFVTCLRFIDRLFGLLGSSSFAEDAVQEALLSAYKNLEQVRAQARMSTWLTAIVFNSARIHLRTLSRQTHVSLDDCSEGENDYSLLGRLPDRGPSPEDAFRGSEDREHLMQMLLPMLQPAFQLCCM
jgi:RNA polymerase sigma factor (sigma-70 family)